MTTLSRQRTPIFVLSTGRCGSTTLSNILNLHPAILSISEFVSFTGIAAFHYRRPPETGYGGFFPVNAGAPA